MKADRYDIYLILEPEKLITPITDKFQVDKNMCVLMPPYYCLRKHAFFEYMDIHKIKYKQITPYDYSVMQHEHNFREIHSCGSNNSTLKFSGTRISWCKKCGTILHEKIIDDEIVDKKTYQPEGL